MPAANSRQKRSCSIPVLASAPFSEGPSTRERTTRTSGIASGIASHGNSNHAVIEPSSQHSGTSTNAPATITVSKTRFAVGEPITVSWTNALGNRYDWLDLHAADATPSTGRLWLWRYIDARIFGSARFKAEATGNWPLTTWFTARGLPAELSDVAAATRPLPLTPPPGRGVEGEWRLVHRHANRLEAQHEPSARMSK